MNRPRKNSHLSSIRQSGNAVKARVLLAGIHRLGLLAREAGVKPSTLSDHLAGRRRNPDTQERIRLAFCTLAAADISGPEFWGELFKDYKSPRRGSDTNDRSAA